MAWGSIFLKTDLWKIKWCGSNCQLEDQHWTHNCDDICSLTSLPWEWVAILECSQCRGQQPISVNIHAHFILIMYRTQGIQLFGMKDFSLPVVSSILAFFKPLSLFCYSQRLQHYRLVKFILDEPVLQILHGEQYMELYKPFPDSGKLTSHARIADILDKGVGALILTEGLHVCYLFVIVIITTQIVTSVGTNDTVH